MEIGVATDASVEQMERIRAAPGRFCPIATLIRGPGAAITGIRTTTPL